MHLRRLLVDNYKCFGEPITIDFGDSATEGRNVFLVGGMNGAGKTSILEAARICLYGAKAQTVFANLNRQRVAKGDASCLFELTLEDADGQPVTLRRSWTAPLGRGEPRVEAGEERLEVARGTEPLRTESPESWQDFTDTHFPPGITQFFFFDGEKIQEMAADERAELRLRASIEAALGIELEQRLAEDIKHIRDEERRQRTDITDEDIELKQTEVKRDRREREQLGLRLSELQTDIAEEQHMLDQARARITSIFGAEPDEAREVKALERRRSELRVRLHEIDDQVLKYVGRDLPLAVLGEWFGPLRDQIAAEAVGQRTSAVRDVAEDLAAAVVEAVTSPETVCCRRPLTASETESMRERAAEVVRAFGLGDDPKAAALLRFSEAEAAKTLSRVEDVERSPLHALRTALPERAQMLEELEEIERRLEPTTGSEASSELLSELQTEVVGYSSQLGQKREELRRVEEEIEHLDESVATKEGDLDLLYKRHEISREHAAFLDQCERLRVLLNDYVERLRESRARELQAKTLEMYRRLASKGDLTAQIEIDPATYVTTVRDHRGDVVPKASLSAGEKEVFAISLLWGLAQTSQLRLPVIIDTPLSRLDSTHRDAIVTEYFPDVGEQVIVLSTDTEVDQHYYELLEDHLQHAVRLVFDKETEMTKVEEGYFWRD